VKRVVDERSTNVCILLPDKLKPGDVYRMDLRAVQFRFGANRSTCDEDMH